MDILPDIILLEIFDNLCFVDLCICSQVCRRWYAIAQSLRLKKKIIVTKHLKHWQLPLLVQYHFHEHLEVFEFWGDCNSSLVTVKKQTFFKLRAKCPKLKKLVLTACSLAYVTLEDMPATLQHLSVRRSEINPYQFFGPRPQFCVPHLTCLDVGGVSNFLTSEDLHIFTKLKSLRCLFLEGCFRINNGGIESITDILCHLEVLDVEGTDISNEGIHTIISHGSMLKELYVGHICIDDDAFQDAHLNRLLKLRTLCIRNTRITSFTMKKFTNSHKSSVNVFSNFDSSGGDSDDSSEKNALDHFVGCNHYLSHVCCR